MAMTSASVPRWPLVLRPLAHRDFRLLWVGQTVSLIGNFAASVAVPWQILLLTGSAVQMGVVVGITNASTLTCLLVGGVFVDRVPRRSVLLWSDFLSFALFALLAVLSATGALVVGHLYVFALISGASFAFFNPAMTAILPELVPESLLVKSNVLRAASRQGARFAGPLLGGALILAAGPTAAFAFNSFSFLCSFVALAAMRPTTPHTRRPTSVLVEAREGIRFTFSLTWLWVTVFGFALINAAFTIPWVGLPILIRDVLRGNALTLGSITAAFAVGEVSGTILLARFRIVRAGTWMYLFAALMGGGLIGMGVAPSLVLTLAAVVGIGIGFVGFGVLWDSVLQRYVPRELLGRVASVDGFGALLLAPVSPVAGGILVELLGAPPVFVAGGAFAILLCLSALVVPSIRRLSLPDQADASVTS